MSQLIPRLSSEEMEPELARLLQPRVERLGYLGDFFRCAAHQPKALISFMAFTEDLKRALPERLTEVVALSVSCFMNNSYERVQHERLSLRLGLPEAWIREVTSLKPGSGGSLAQEEQLVARLVIAVLERDGQGTQPELEAVIHAIGAAKAVALLMLIGRYVAHALIVNCLALEPPVRSPLEAH